MKTMSEILHYKLMDENNFKRTGKIQIYSINSSAAPVTMVWSYIAELVFNMLVLVGAVKMADRVVREMMGL